MMNFVMQLKRESEDRVYAIELMELNVMKKSREASNIFGEAFDRLKEYIINYQFKDDAEEIYFFKHVKPLLCSHLIYHRKVYNIEMNRPVDNETQKEYLHKELASIQDFIDKRLDFYRYFRLGSTNQDAYYFMRGKMDNELYLESYYHDRDPLFCTDCDFKVARILANDMLEIFLKLELDTLENHNQLPCDKSFPKTKRTWTGSKSDLIEQLYAWDTEGCFDNDSISLTQMTAYIENVFNIDLGQNISKIFSEMRYRKQPTSFLDRLKEKILLRMLHPNKQTNVNDKQ